MSVTDTIFGRWELAVADDVNIRNGSRNNIGAQTYNTYNQYNIYNLYFDIHVVFFKAM
jgi:hypothetical protein